MAAPDFETVYKFGDNIVVATVAFMEGDTPALPAYGPRETAAVLPKERIDVVASAFVKASEQMTKDSLGNWYDSHYSGQLIVTIRTPRADATAAGKHGTRVGRVQYLMSRRAQKFTSVNLPYYEVLSTDLTGQAYEYEDKDACDCTELTFDVQVNILGSAFPTS